MSYRDPKNQTALIPNLGDRVYVGQGFDPLGNAESEFSGFVARRSFDYRLHESGARFCVVTIVVEENDTRWPEQQVAT